MCNPLTMKPRSQVGGAVIAHVLEDENRLHEHEMKNNLGRAWTNAKLQRPYHAASRSKNALRRNWGAGVACFPIAVGAFSVCTFALALLTALPE